MGTIEFGGFGIVPAKRYVGYEKYVNKTIRDFCNMIRNVDRFLVITDPHDRAPEKQHETSTHIDKMWVRLK